MSRDGSARWPVAGVVLLFASFSAGVAAQSGGQQRTEIEYDERGRVREVRTVVSQQAPAVESVSPAAIGRTTSVNVRIEGRGLRGASVATDDAGLTASAVTTSESAVNVRLSAGAAVSLGPHGLTVTTPLGSAIASIDVVEAPPALAVTPDPLLVASGAAAQIDARFATPATRQHVIAFSVEPTGVVVVAPQGVVVEAGETVPAAPILVTATGSGGARLTALVDGTVAATTDVFVVPRWSPAPGSTWTFEAAPVGVSVSGVAPPVAKPAFAASSTVGVTVESSEPPEQLTRSAWTTAVGVSVGPVAYGVVPSTIGRGSTATLEVDGDGLAGVDTITIEPALGISLVGEPIVAADGRRVSVQVSIAADAPATLRRVVLLRGGTLVPFARAGSDQVRITN